MYTPNKIEVIEAIRKPSSGVIMLLHGYAQSLEIMKPMANYLASILNNKTIILLNGFNPVGIGYKWFETCVYNINDWHNEYNMALASLKGYIGKMSVERGISAKDVSIIGFSQGAIMALQVGLELQLGDIVSLSGFLIDEAVIEKREQKSRILMIQNGLDPIVPMEALETSKRNFNKYNYTADYCVIPGVLHNIGERSFELISEFLLKGGQE